LGVWEDLKNEDFEVTNYFYNPNIWPEEEYKKRKENLEIAINNIGTNLIEGEYVPREHDNAVHGIEADFPKRCLKCYELRLQKTAEYAKENDYDLFSTTLLVSPYQNHEALIEIGKRIEKKVGVKFYEADFRPYFRTGQDMARELEIYRQKYCGCKYSINN
jgi:predicted adenine nucleotide alpha hydrolase (AANH) superfamily ATPase